MHDSPLQIKEIWPMSENKPMFSINENESKICEMEAYIVKVYEKPNLFDVIYKVGYDLESNIVHEEFGNDIADEIKKLISNEVKRVHHNKRFDEK